MDSILKELLADAAPRAARYTADIGSRRVAAGHRRGQAHGSQARPKPSLDDIGPSVTVAATGGRYFGFGYRLRPKV